MNREEIEEIISRNHKKINSGEVADYIPELKNMDPTILGVTIASINRDSFTIGDCDQRFTIQSISKVIALIVALKDCGFDKVFSKVGMEASGDPFNSIIKLETLQPNKPFNPMINAGAIAITSLIKGQNGEASFHRIIQLLQTITGSRHIELNEAVYQSEKETGNRNRSLAYFMKSTGILEGDPEEALDLYFKICSINVTCSDLAKIGLWLSNGGQHPHSKEQIIEPEIAKIVLTIMMTSGMYNASGEFAVQVGFPAKSGVSGGIMAVVPGKMGIGVISPPIDKKGNSVIGVHVLEDISKQFQLHQFHV
ncbi:glutaminase A [Aquibacillus sp. 3ASR75-11]|uniref:Glutaminase n=1 Tax=Terrihalobacillus insolitus TaxID=2950438 RepID=A0A9X3WSU6_9BACI|nr:glutaminase A [Terrihalobacillus insolitus]MDC3414457.1 glutaminase A [Terrihalobacillus insolitus]MDC3425337.1 glutaminase A [Terrihalobacillus insolitus]